MKAMNCSLIVGLLFLSASIQAADLYIAPDGADTNPGTKEAPLASLNGARSSIRKLIAHGLKAPVTVTIRGGEYPLRETVVFDPKDSGTEKYPVTYRAYANETPVFTGGIKLTDWKKVEGNLPGISDAAKGKVVYCEIPDRLKGKWQITSLYDGLTLLPRSRSPELVSSKDQVKDPNNEQPKKMGFMGYDDEPVSFNRVFHFEGEDLKEWKQSRDIELYLSPRYGWMVNVLPLESIDIQAKTATVAIDPTYCFVGRKPYYVENAIEYLDEPGEWVFDSANGCVYLWPSAPIEAADIRAPYLQEFIRVDGVGDGARATHIHFEGLTFRHGLRDTWKPDDIGLQHDWDMYDKGNAILRFRHAEHCSVKGCTFEASSGDGVRSDLYGQRLQIVDNLFHHLGGTGILLNGYGPGLKDENKFNVIHNNYLHHIGAIYKHAPGIFIAQSGHNEITHNTIHDLAYNGIVISGCRPAFLTRTKPLKNRREWIGTIRAAEVLPRIKDLSERDMQKDLSIIEPFFHARENLIAYNEIYRVMLELHDGNGIYFSGMGKDNVCEYNYIYDLGGSRGFIRLDDVSAFTIIKNNVCRNGDNMFMMKGPCEVDNNFGIDLNRLNFIPYAGYGLTHLVFYNTKPDGTIHYEPDSKLGKSNPKEIVAEKNAYAALKYLLNSLVYDVTPIPEFDVGDDLVPTDKRNGATVGIRYADPMFDEAAMKQKIFRFKPGSPAIKLGIQPIDLSTAGSTLAR
ncbi:right-handed parallel beta-helix repeat-containing protein [Pontiellaceae bacterium B12219]|nr:right-handed parallel beta-helix repeat-containing protein [Pontiellaceae bacterium B12219]